MTCGVGGGEGASEEGAGKGDMWRPRTLQHAGHDISLPLRPGEGAAGRGGAQPR